LTEAGWSREKAYTLVQTAAMKVLREEVSFRDALLQDSEVQSTLGSERLTALLRVEPRYDMAEEILRRLDILE
jgi:adenylosuccinate lyase